jgi:hypothetical protein
MITILFYNKFDKSFLAKFTFPYNKNKSLNNYYSKFYKKMKLTLANINKLDKHWVRANININHP